MGGAAQNEAHLLGPPLFHMGGAVVEPTPSKQWFVPVYLAAHGGWVFRDELGALLWGEGTDSRARHNLRQVVHVLSRTPVGQALDIEDDRLRFVGRTDLAAFTREIDRGNWREALEHYRAPFLSGWTFPAEPNVDAWIIRRREEVEVAYRSALRASADQLAHTAPAAAARLYERLWRHDVLDEEALRKQLYCLKAAGMATVAAEAARSYRTAFASELDADPDGDISELLDAAVSRKALAAGEPLAPTALASLPAYPTPFVGRREELARLETLSGRGESRLVSIVGLGGSGKTRLALEFAGRAAHNGQPVTWASLVDVASKAEIIAEMASALGIASKGGSSSESLARHVGERAMLMVVDSAEDVREELVDVVDHVLSRCPHATFLITTRIVLGARFEHVLKIDGLALGDSPTAESIPCLSNTPSDTPSDAATLFHMSTARRVQSTEADIGSHAVEQICREVEGMPLAIELIASWTDVLSTEELLAEVRDGLSGITDGGALSDLPERQRSLRSVLDGTWRRLSAAGRDALLAIAPCVGSVSFSDAKALGVGLEGLRALADAAILRRDDDRLSAHPLVIDFVRKRAQEGSDRWQSLEARHAAHYVGKLTTVPKAPPAYREELFPDLGNLRSAVVWAAEHADVHTFGEALFGLHLVETSRGLMGDPALTKAIAHRARGPNRVHALGREVWQLLHDAISDYGYHMATPREDAQRAKSLALEALAAARSADEPMLVRLALHDLAIIHLHLGEHQTAIEYSREGLRVGTDWGWATLLDKLAHAQSCIGEYASARRSFLRALAWTCRRSGRIADGWIPHSIVLLDLYTGQFDAAGRVTRAIAHATDAETPLQWRIERFVVAGSLATSRGDLAAAAHAFDRALELCEGMDSTYRDMRGSMIHGRRAHAAILASDPETAKRHLAACQSPGYGPLWRGRLALAESEHRSAVRELATAVDELPEESYELEFVAAHIRARTWLGAALTAAGELTAATQEIEAALEHALRRKLPVEVLACAAGVAALWEAQGELIRGASLRDWVRDHAATDADTRLAVGGRTLRQAKDADAADVFDRARRLLEGLREGSRSRITDAL